jgi:hypothetical protein
VRARCERSGHRKRTPGSTYLAQQWSLEGLDRFHEGKDVAALGLKGFGWGRGVKLGVLFRLFQVGM